MTELIFIRHGQTHANIAGRWDGWSDDVLTSLGYALNNCGLTRVGAEEGRARLLVPNNEAHYTYLKE